MSPEKSPGIFPPASLSDISQPPTPGRRSRGQGQTLADLSERIQKGEPGAREALAEFLGPEKAAFLNQPDVSDVLTPSLREETLLDTPPQTDNRGLRETLREGPSRLIEGQIEERLGVVTAEGVSMGGIPRSAWVLNPKAWFEALKARAIDASTQAGVQREISETAEWMARVAGDDAKRDALLIYSESLEATLGRYVEPFCVERGLPVPGKDTLGRITLLLRMNAEIRAVHERGRQIAHEGEVLVRGQVGIQAETARNTMLTRELPEANRVAELAHRGEETRIWEEERTLFAKIGGGTVAIVTGVLGGVTHALSEGVKNMPLIAVPLGMVSIYLVCKTVTLIKSSFSFSSIAGGVVLIGITTILGTGIGSGLVAHFTEGKKQSSISMA